MNTGTDPSNALASLLAILSQSTQPPSSDLTSHPEPNSQPPPPANHPVNLQNIEPVFIEEDIFETTQWIGVPTVPWSEPRNWQFPQPDPTVLAQRRIPPTTPTIPEKRKRSPSPAPQKTQSVSPGSPKTTFTNYSLALKHVLRQSEDAEFMDAVRRVKKRQDDIETDLWEDRERIKRSFDSKRKMNRLLQSLGSQFKDEQVPSPLPVGLTKTLLEEEKGELKTFDESVLMKWGEVVREQEDEMRRLGVPYFGGGDGEGENRGKMFAFLEDLISAGNE